MAFMTRLTSLAGRHEVILKSLDVASYYIRDRAEAFLPLSVHAAPASTAIPTTVIHADSGQLSLELLQKSIHRFQEQDDVFNGDFVRGAYIFVHLVNGTVTEGLLLDGKGQTLEIDSEYTPPIDLEDFLADHSLHLFVTRTSPVLPEGPYFTRGHTIHQAWRLFPDELNAFTASVVPNDDAENQDQFTVMPWSQTWGGGGLVAVPSRLYFQKSPLPLAGMRLSVKDNMHLSGTITTLGNKAYAELYGKQASSAEYLQHLIQQGAVVLGKTKLCAFAGSELPPSQCIDYFAPWNPRGDGYQGPSGSSSGAAASVAGYSWLDISLCTDTTGSMRHPATCHGLWGHKITWGAVPMNGVVPACQVFDSIGVLGRAPGKIEMLLSALNVNNRSANPVEILYPTDWFPLQSEHQQKMTEEFLERLEAFTSLKRTSISIAEKWIQTAPEEFRGTSLKDFLGTVPNMVNGYDNLHNFDEFCETYRLKFGKEPYVSPTHRQRWDTRRNVTAQERDEGLIKVQKYREWATDVLFGGDSAKVMVVPQGRPGANYRDGVGNSGHAGTPAGPLGPIFTISMWGLPQVIVPIGQHPYQSRVSGLEEQAPMFTTLVGPAGTDVGLLQLAVNCLQAAGKLTEVLPGRYMFAPPTVESANLNEQDDRNAEDGIAVKSSI